MKQITNWNDLREYGITCLTGEACSIGARALCDVTEQGAELVREFLGLPYDAKFQENWNSGAVGSVFLPWDILPALAAFVLVKQCGTMAVSTGHGVYAPEETDTDEDWQKWLDFEQSNIIRYYRPINGSRRGLSAVHAFSGRSQ